MGLYSPSKCILHVTSVTNTIFPGSLEQLLHYCHVCQAQNTNTEVSSAFPAEQATESPLPALDTKSQCLKHLLRKYLLQFYHGTTPEYHFFLIRSSEKCLIL